MSTGQDWVEQARRLVDAFRAGAEEPAAPAADCRWCPLCQAAAVLRGERPEVSAALADVLTATATALRAFADGGAAPEPAAGEPEQPERPAPAVQRIDLA